MKFKFIFNFIQSTFSCIPTQKTKNRYKAYAERLRPLVKDTISYLHTQLKEGKSILVEGANAAMLDIDFGNFISPT